MGVWVKNNEDLKKNKTYTGLELLKAMVEDEIKEGTKLVDEYGNIIYFNGYNLREDDAEGRYYRDTIDDVEFCIRKFKTIEEIDIQDIEEMKEVEEDILTEIAESFNEERAVINGLIKAIKQLDNKIKEVNNGK